jgi:2-polyprenyl-3-methyl-5-hydroxy-6-metoxy-1,4-benzoquinol methylase
MIEWETARPAIADSLYKTKESARIYDKIYTLTEKRDIKFWINTAKRLNPRNILEIGAGTGRIAIPLAENGFSVTGLDLEQSMLDIAIEKTERLPQKIQNRLEYVLGDARSINLNQTFDLITIPLNTFCHFLTKEDQIGVLSNLKKHLDPERGVLIIDMFNPLGKKAQQWNSLEQGEIPADRLPLKIYLAFDTVNKLIITRIIRDYVDLGKTKEAQFRPDTFFIDRESQVVDFSVNPPIILQNRAVFQASRLSFASVWLEKLFEEAGFEKHLFLGDYDSSRFLDVEEEDQGDKIIAHFDRSSKKMIVVVGPGQKRLRVKEHFSKKPEKASDSVLEASWNDQTIEIPDNKSAVEFLNFMIKFEHLSSRDQKELVRRMPGVLREVKNSKTPNLNR